MDDSATLSATSKDTPQEESKHFQFNDTDFCVVEDFVVANLLATLRELFMSPVSEYRLDSKDDKANQKLRGKHAKPFPLSLDVLAIWRSIPALVKLIEMMRQKIQLIKTHGGEVKMFAINRTYSLYEGKSSDDFGWHLDEDGTVSAIFYLFEIEAGECEGELQGGNIIYWKNGTSTFENSSGFRSRPGKGVGKDIETGTIVCKNNLGVGFEGEYFN